MPKAARRAMKTTVGIVGLGLLGHAVASRLLAGGHAVVGYDVLPERLRAVETLGGEPAASPEAVARSAELVCTLLPSLATVETAVFGPRGSWPAPPAASHCSR